jgi:carbamoyltransferase
LIILGLNCSHGDSSAAIVRDGTLEAAAEEERFRRIKHWAGFPAQAIAYCLEEAASSLADVDRIAVNQDSRANLVGKLRYVLSRHPNPGLLWSRWRIRRARISITSLLQSVSDGSFKAPVV